MTGTPKKGRITRLSDERGFSLLELMVVIVIVGITAAIATPKFNNLNSSIDLDATRRLLMSTINTAGRLSKATRKDIYLTFKFSEEKLIIQYDQDDDGDTTDLYLTKTIPDGINLAGATGQTTDYTVVFNDYGTTSSVKSIHFAVEGKAYVVGNEDDFRTVTWSNSTQKPRYYNFGKNTPFP